MHKSLVPRLVYLGPGQILVISSAFFPNHKGQVNSSIILLFASIHCHDGEGLQVNIYQLLSLDSCNSLRVMFKSFV